MVNIPTIIKFPKLGNSSLGYISLIENELLPFEVKRVYWTYHTPKDVERGGHSHLELKQILVAIAGSITVKTELVDGTQQIFSLDSPDIGLLIPNRCWREMKYSHNAVQMCIASSCYDEHDYIRNYNEFKILQ